MNGSAASTVLPSHDFMSSENCISSGPGIFSTAASLSASTEGDRMLLILIATGGKSGP